MEGEWPCYRGGSIMEGTWSCYRGGYFNGGKMVVTELVSVGTENGYVTGGQLKREHGHVTEVISLMEGEQSLQS